MNDGGSFTAGATGSKPACYSASDIPTSNKNIADIINADFLGGQTVGITLDTLQIYSIYLNDS
jgi:hypothetical protein